MTLILSGTNGLSDVDGSAATPAIRGTDTNTGVFFPAADTVGISTGGTERARVDSAGNLGLAATPTNNTLGKTLQVGQAGAWVAESGSNRWWLANNWYYNSGDKYINNGYATLYSQQNGTHQWQIAASGTAGGTVSFTQAMTLDASGNLGVGTTSPTYPIDVVSNSGANALKIRARSGNDYGFMQFSSNDGATRWAEIYATNSSALAFTTGSSGTERARIDSSGNFLVGKTSTDESVQGIDLRAPSGLVVITRSNADPLSLRRTSSDGAIISFRRDASLVGSVSVTTTATAYNTSSDYRLKNTIAPMTGALAKVALLKPCTYKWNADGSDGEGFIAHELAEVVPQCVTGEKDAVETYTDEEGNEQTRPVYQGIDTSFLVATLTAAIQEQQALIAQLQADVAALKGNA